MKTAFTVTNSGSGWETKEVYVDGASQGAITFYTFSSVTADHAINATFRAVTTDVYSPIINQDFSKDKASWLKIFPNPSNTISTVSYQLSEQGHVSLRIYDIYGRQVATLFDGYQTKGQYRQTWDAIVSNGRLLQNGNYFLRFESANSVKTIMVILMK